MPVKPKPTEVPTKTKSKVIKMEKQVEKNETSSLQGITPEDLIFALDIGTRTIVGIVGVADGDHLRVISAEVVEHRSRAMMDGQIHDIGQVAEIAREVKTKLESNIGMPLTNVAIAAAGRVLKTCEVKVERSMEVGSEITQELVSSIEIEAIQLAQTKLDEELPEDEKTQYYCVGYSIINYYLNGYVISSLAGHRGKKVGVDVLATFLPHVVVDSLYTVMGKIGLEVTSLTLEPIAAINVTIPKDLRLLNLALVDIGAGTSDIAITREGSVIAYGMAPIAGDEITEKISQHFLVDFNTGEKIKIALKTGKDQITFTDVLGKKCVVGREEVLAVIRPSVEILADTISKKILEFNHKAPNAVFLIGGGSQTPELAEMLAGFLKISSERVAVRKREMIHHIKYKGKKLSGPEAITPFGIALTAKMNRGHDFLSVTLNGKKIRLFNSKKLTVADALVLVGFNAGQLIGRTGKSLVFEINEEQKTIRGEHGKPAEIYVNNKLAGLDCMIQVGDVIDVIPAENGSMAKAVVRDFIKKNRDAKVSFNENMMDIAPRAYINGKVVSTDQEIYAGDAVRIIEILTVGDLLRDRGLLEEELEIYVKDHPVEISYLLENNDCVKTVLCSQPQPETPIQQDLNRTVHAPSLNTLNINEVDVGRIHPLDEGIAVTINGEPVVMQGTKSQLIFVDIFNYINFDLSKPQGNIVLRLNGQQAAFTDVVKTGDVIDIYWNK